MDISNSACLLVTSVSVFIGVRLSVRRVTQLTQTPPDAALYAEALTELCLYVNKTGTKRYYARSLQNWSIFRRLVVTDNTDEGWHFRLNQKVKKNTFHRPYLTAMVNTPLRCSCLPASQKTTVVTPLLKKASLEMHELKN